MVIVCCPQCGLESNYDFKPNTKRQRKQCTGTLASGAPCKRKFELNGTRAGDRRVATSNGPATRMVQVPGSSNASTKKTQAQLGAIDASGVPEMDHSMDHSTSSTMDHSIPRVVHLAREVMPASRECSKAVGNLNATRKIHSQIAPGVLPAPISTINDILVPPTLAKITVEQEHLVEMLCKCQKGTCKGTCTCKDRPRANKVAWQLFPGLKAESRNAIISKMIKELVKGGYIWKEVREGENNEGNYVAVWAKGRYLANPLYFVWACPGMLAIDGTIGHEEVRAHGHYTKWQVVEGKQRYLERLGTMPVDNGRSGGHLIRDYEFSKPYWVFENYRVFDFKVMCYSGCIKWWPLSKGYSEAEIARNWDVFNLVVKKLVEEYLDPAGRIVLEDVPIPNQAQEMQYSVEPASGPVKLPGKPCNSPKHDRKNTREWLGPHGLDAAINDSKFKNQTLDNAAAIIQIEKGITAFRGEMHYKLSESKAAFDQFASNAMSIMDEIGEAVSDRETLKSYMEKVLDKMSQMVNTLREIGGVA
jgi:hypothetical protein